MQKKGPTFNKKIILRVFTKAEQRGVSGLQTAVKWKLKLERRKIGGAVFTVKKCLDRGIGGVYIP